MVPLALIAPSPAITSSFRILVQHLPGKMVCSCYYSQVFLSFKKQVAQNLEEYDT
jgi:hypothetical protein